ncbi:ATP-grasp domain-containing protein [Kitasatospora sp. NPDC051984]|uniref:ATP-grasp domain-containing protein n=1 Tax=Kitasatospora sp. NPDC051984 TaxID=3364059 RepID=UPI0037C62AE8
MPKLLLVGVGELGLPYLIAAKRLRASVGLVETPGRAALLRDLVDEVFPVAGTAEEQWSEAALGAAARWSPDGVLALGEPQVLAAALTAGRHGLPGPSLGAAVVSRNKALQRAVFAAAGLPQPASTVTERLGAAADWAAERLPVVVKPLSSSGSSGVELVPDAAAWADAVRRRDGEGRLLVESAVTGPEFSWEGLVRDGQVLLGNVTEKETGPAPYFVEVAHRVGTAAPATVAAGQQLGRQVVEALDMRTGIVHLEFRLTADGPAIIEVAVRTPGDSIMDAVGLVHGLDLYEAVVRLALGLPTPAVERARQLRCSASLFPTATPGRVVAVHGAADVRGRPGVARVHVGVRPGDTVGPIRCSADRPAAVLVEAADPESLEKAVAGVRATLLVETEPTP